jgi:hypothetical protein
MPEIGLSIPLAEFYEGLQFGANSVEDEDNDRPPPPTAWQVPKNRFSLSDASVGAEPQEKGNRAWSRPTAGPCERNATLILTLDAELRLAVAVSIHADRTSAPDAYPRSAPSPRFATIASMKSCTDAAPETLALPVICTPAISRDKALRIRGGAFVAIGDDSRIPSPIATRRLLWASTLRSHALEQRFFQVGATSHVPAPSQLIFSARGRAPAEGCARLSLSGVHHALRGRRRDQARRIGIAARTTRTLAKTLRVLECRPGADRDAGEREFDTNASRRARTLRSH